MLLTAKIYKRLVRYSWYVMDLDTIFISAIMGKVPFIFTQDTLKDTFVTHFCTPRNGRSPQHPLIAWDKISAVSEEVYILVPILGGDVHRVFHKEIIQHDQLLTSLAIHMVQPLG